MADISKANGAWLLPVACVISACQQRAFEKGTGGQSARILSERRENLQPDRHAILIRAARHIHRRAADQGENPVERAVTGRGSVLWGR